MTKPKPKKQKAKPVYKFAVVGPINLEEIGGLDELHQSQKDAISYEEGLYSMGWKDLKKELKVRCVKVKIEEV